MLGTLFVNNAAMASILLISAKHLHNFTQGPSHAKLQFHKAPSQFVPLNDGAHLRLKAFLERNTKCKMHMFKTALHHTF